MALNRDDMIKRRARREKLRKQQLRQQRRMVLSLIAAGVVLALCALVILWPRSGGDTPGQNDSTSSLQTSLPAETAPDGPTTVIHFAATGDLNVTNRVVASGGTAMDYTQAFLDVLPVLSGADLTAVNFEGNLIGEPYGQSTMSAPYGLMGALADAGVDLVQLANSRSVYNGIKGLVSTIQAVRSAGMESVGVYTSQEDFRESGGYTIYNVKGVRVAVVAFTKGMDGMSLPAGNEDCVNLLYTDYASNYQKVDTEGITSILSYLEEEEEPDVTIALLHWGSEFNDKISSSQKSIVRLMQQNGVDAIIGTHSHYVQQMIFDPDNGTFVAYSLGDFFGDASRAGSEYSVILDLEITKDNESGATKITNFSYTPIYTVHDEGEDLHILRIHDAMAAYEANAVGRISDTAYAEMAYALQRIEARIHGK